MARPWLIASVTLLGGGMALFAAQGAQAPAIDIDHVILGIDDLERGIRQFATQTGVTAARGGEHPGRGTRNALVGLDKGRYLEILAPAASRPPGAPHDARVDYAELTPTGWALQTRAIADTVARLRAAGFPAGDPRPGSRRKPDGTLLEWQVSAVDEKGFELAPFFIEWSRATAHPGTSSPAGCALVGVELTHPEPARLQAFFAAAGFPATVTAARRSGMRLTLDCPRGRVHFTS